MPFVIVLNTCCHILYNGIKLLEDQLVCILKCSQWVVVVWANWAWYSTLYNLLIHSLRSFNSCLISFGLAYVYSTDIRVGMYGTITSQYQILPMNMVLDIKDFKSWLKGSYTTWTHIHQSNAQVLNKMYWQ